VGQPAYVRSMDERPRGALFRDQVTAVVWAAVLALDEGAQHELLAELRKRLSAPRERQTLAASRVARAISALRQADALLGHAPSVEDYRRLRLDHPDWPADSSLRAWLGGSWNQSLERAHLDRVPDVLAIAPDIGGAFTRDEVIAAVQECAKDLGRVPAFHDYRGWVTSPRVRQRPGRRPKAQRVFERRFGGWLGSLVAAGLARDDGTGAPTSNGCLGRGRAYTDEQLYQAMQEIAELAGSKTLPRTSHYDQLRFEILDEERSKGLPPRAFPGSDKLRKRFGGWGEVRAAFEAWQRSRESDG
jgi:hypothetical protein